MLESLDARKVVPYNESKRATAEANVRRWWKAEGQLCGWITAKAAASFSSWTFPASS
jgi:hypothetical protein